MSLSKFNFKVYGIKNVRISKKQDRKKQRQELLQKALPVLDLEQKSRKKRKMSASKVLSLCSELNLTISTKVSIPGQDLDQGMDINLIFYTKNHTKCSENYFN